MCGVGPTPPIQHTRANARRASGVRTGGFIYRTQKRRSGSVVRIVCTRARAARSRALYRTGVCLCPPLKMNTTESIHRAAKDTQRNERTPCIRKARSCAACSCEEARASEGHLATLLSAGTAAQPAHPEGVRVCGVACEYVCVVQASTRDDRCGLLKERPCERSGNGGGAAVRASPSYAREAEEGLAP